MRSLVLSISALAIGIGGFFLGAWVSTQLSLSFEAKQIAREIDGLIWLAEQIESKNTEAALDTVENMLETNQVILAVSDLGVFLDDDERAAVNSSIEAARTFLAREQPADGADE